jgi:hypothetical protein
MWTQELRWHDIAHAAIILQSAGLIDVVPNFEKATMMKLNARLNASPNIRKRKDGTAQSSPAWYKAKFSRRSRPGLYNPKKRA